MPRLFLREALPLAMEDTDSTWRRDGSPAREVMVEFLPPRDQAATQVQETYASEGRGVEEAESLINGRTFGRRVGGCGQPESWHRRRIRRARLVGERERGEGERRRTPDPSEVRGIARRSSTGGAPAHETIRPSVLTPRVPKSHSRIQPVPFPSPGTRRREAGPGPALAVIGAGDGPAARAGLSRCRRQTGGVRRNPTRRSRRVEFNCDRCDSTRCSTAARGAPTSPRYGRRAPSTRGGRSTATRRGWRPVEKRWQGRAPPQHRRKSPARALPAGGQSSG